MTAHRQPAGQRCGDEWVPQKDTQVLKSTGAGKFLLQIGKHGVSGPTAGYEKGPGSAVAQHIEMK
jgi:hypothetical protein